jgi:hypothetical protein
MRIKSLLISVSFLVFPLVLSSCLDSDNTYELSSDNLITAFSLDTIYGKTYTFTIDQLEGKIYNVDSVAFGADTIINRILITTLTTNGYVTAGTDMAEPFPNDTLFNYADSIDFITHNPLVVRVRSYDGRHIKPYEIEVRIHRADPDTLVWGEGPYASILTNGEMATAKESKAVLLNDQILLFASDGDHITAYGGPSTSQFQKITLTGLAADTKVSSILNVKDATTLYGATENGKVFSTTNGADWAEVASDSTVVTLITTFDDTTIAGIIKAGTANVFAAATVNADGSLKWTTEGNTVPDGFPTGHIVATKSYTTPTGGQQALLIGEPAGATATTPWFSTNGLNWGAMTPSKIKYALPAMEEPSILYYGDTIYAFGRTTDGFSSIYTSKNGIVWEEIKKKFMFPSAFKDKSGYTMVVDKDNYIRMFWYKDDEAWRGKLNRLGFIKTPWI